MKHMMHIARRFIVTAAASALAYAALVILPRMDVAAENDSGVLRDGESDANGRASNCKLSVAGAVYAYMSCSARTAHREYLAIDGGVDPTPRIFISGHEASPSVHLWFHVIGEPKVGAPNFVMVAFVEQPPASWRAIANFSATTGSADINLTEVRKVRMDGGLSYELHGTFVATMPEVTGVRGPDVVLSGTF